MTPNRSTRCSRGGSPTSIAATREDAAEAAQVAARSGPTPTTRSSTTRKRPRFSYPPKLLIVDGGQPQVAAAARALEESGIQGIQLAGIAKRLEEMWLPDSDFPVILPRNSEALFLIQRIRDEAHRFAITHQRRAGDATSSRVLSEIPGLGPSRIKDSSSISAPSPRSRRRPRRDRGGERHRTELAPLRPSRS